MSQTASTPACTCGLIDVHAHCLPPTYKKALAEAGLTSLDGGFPVPEWSAGSALEVMDREGIETMMLSVSSPSVGFIPDKRARVALARRINEEVAEVMAAHPGRFGGFATLPLPHLPECLDEVRYSLDELGLHGVVLETNYDGTYLGDKAFLPLFQQLARRNMPVFLHPTSPACFEQVGLGRPAPLFEFPVDSARAVIDMIFAGVFEQAPGFKLILSHSGGVLPSIARRIAALSAMPAMRPAPQPGAEVMRIFAELHYDLAMSANQPTFDYLRTLAPLSQILFGTDYPFQKPDNVAFNTAGFRALKGLSSQEHEAVARGNAERLFPGLRGAKRPQ